MKAKRIGWSLALGLAVAVTACAPAVGPDPVKNLTINMDRATNSVDVTGDIGPFTLSVGVATVTDADGLDIPLANLNLSDVALTDITVTLDNGSAVIGAMAPLTANPNQEGLKAKLDYIVYALSALYSSGALSANPTQEAAAYDMLSQLDTARSTALEFVTDESIAVAFEAEVVYNDGTTDMTTQQSLEHADSTYILPYMNAIMAWFDANQTDAAIFQEGLLKVWWNKLDTANDADLNTAVETEIKTLYPDVNSVL